MEAHRGTPVGIMRDWWGRFLVVLLALALIGGNTHIDPHPVIYADHDCAEAGAHPHKSSVDSTGKFAGGACCCDCLGCLSPMSLSPPLTAVMLRFPVEAIRYGWSSSLRSGQTLLPDPPPPRPGALS